MILVVDANILFSALIKNSTTAKLMLDENLILITPEYIVDEFLKYEDIILKKTRRTKQEFNQIVHLLKDIIEIIPYENYVEYVREASKISPDEKDILYLALALRYKCALWSNDKDLKKQKRVKVYSTQELMVSLGKQ